MDAFLNANDDVDTWSDTLSCNLPSTDIVEQEHEYTNFESNLGPAEDEVECVEPHNEFSSKPSEESGLDQHNVIVADNVLTSAQDNVIQNISHLWPYLSPYQAITLTYIKKLYRGPF